MNRYLFAICFLISTSAFSQELKLLSALPEVLKGVSGMEVFDDSTLVMINDHGNPILYFIDRKTYDIAETTYLNNKMIDWEDLTIDSKGNIYIGDFGNNKNRRTDLKIYKIQREDSSKSIVTAEIIRFKLSDQSDFPPRNDKLEFDIESMAYYNDNLYLFSKSRGRPFKGFVKTYKLPIYAGTHIAELQDSTYVGSNKMYENWITGADIRDNQLVLLTHGKIFIYSCFDSDNFFQNKPAVIHLNHFSQKEAICFDGLSNDILISDERTKGIIGGNIYSIKVAALSNPCP